MLFKRKIYFLFIFLVALTLSSIVYENYENTKGSDVVDVKSFEKVLLRKKNLLDSLLNRLIAKSKSIDVIKVFSEQYYTQSISNTGFAFLIYENNSLKFWSDNSIAVLNEFYLPEFERNSIVYLNNAWVVPVVKKESDRTYVGLILVKHLYQFENDLIKNGFQKDFNVNPNVLISNIPSSDGFAVLDENGDFIFSLVPDNNPEKQQSGFTVSVLLYSLVLLVLLFFMYYVIKYLYYKFPNNILLLIFFIVLAVIRFLMLKFRFPASFYSLDFFGPQFYASSRWLPSLGDFLINSLFLTFFIATLYRLYIFRQLQKRASVIYALIFLLFVEIFYIGIISLTKTLVYNSSIPLDIHNILNTGIYSLVLILIAGMLILSFLILSIKVIYNYHTYFHTSFFLLLIFISWSVICLTIYLSGYTIDIFSIIFLPVFLVVLTYFSKIKHVGLFAASIFHVVVISVFVTGFIYLHNNEKEKKIRKLLVVNLANERDPIGELQLEEFEKKLKTDKFIIEQFSGPYRDADIILNHLLRNYFHGYWGKYDLEITICNEYDSLIVETGNIYNCYEYYADIDNNEGLKIGNTNFYYLDNNNGRISYSGHVSYLTPVDSSEITLFIRLDSRLISTELGYPELLIENNMKNSNINKYSYAKYSNNRLMAKQGDFTYDLKPGIFNTNNNEFSFYNYNDYNHLVYRIGKDNIIILSKPVVSALNIIVAFSYILIFFFLLSLCYYIYRSIPVNKPEINFKAKIQISMISLMFLSLIVIGTITIYYNVNQFQKNHFKIISEKTQSVLVELEHKFGNYNKLTIADREKLTYWLVKFSNVFYSDINMYDLNGYLLATSRPEIFNKGLIDDRINPQAFRELKLNYKNEFIHKEQIGKLSYLSAYVPFNSVDNNQLAYLNLPYFTKQNLLTAEISNLIIAFINIYILLFIIAIAVSVVISNSITKPLRLIQKRFQKIQLDKTNEPIIYNKNDEIGELITEYNRMLKEIAKSAELLGKSERESAWREMAKQIAHEIKNPLTPMKLSIQHLNKAWENKDKNYDILQRKVTSTLIEQIDSLSTIATEFSNFALMPKTKNEKLNLAKKIQHFVDLFKNVPQKIEVEVNNNEEVFVFADKDQLARVFNNLINNAIQAISNETYGIIKISLKMDGDFVVVTVADNGSGISDELKDKIFEPNFTTKTGGMGLGLAMVKKIIEDANGKIWFETQINKGTIFYIKLPVYKG